MSTALDMGWQGRTPSRLLDRVDDALVTGAAALVGDDVLNVDDVFVEVVRLLQPGQCKGSGARSRGFRLVLYAPGRPRRHKTG